MIQINIIPDSDFPTQNDLGNTKAEEVTVSGAGEFGTHTLRVKYTHPDAKLLTPAQEGDAGHDIVAFESVLLPSWEIVKWNSKIAVEIPKGYLGIVSIEKSGIGAQGVLLLSGAIDSTYRGEISILFFNLNRKAIAFEKGRKVAQLIIVPVLAAKHILEATELSETERGSGGFGSTGMIYTAPTPTIEDLPSWKKE